MSRLSVLNLPKRLNLRNSLSRLIQIFSLPLLSKELIEQSQRPRTYALRVLCAVVLYGAALLQYSTITGSGSTAGLLNLGSGRELFRSLVFVQGMMILFILPPITCGAMTIEKEKDTLALLLLTKLSPWTIVFEKMLSRVVAMGTYQLLSVPLFAIVYGIGGVEIENLLFAIAGLISLTMIVSSISIFCSTWFRTTAAAFVTTYAILICFGCFSVPFLALSPGIWMLRSNSLIDPWFAFLMGLIGLGFMVGLSMFASGIILMTASKILIPRAFVPIRNVVLELFQRADWFFNELNKRTTGGVILVRDSAAMPTFRSIAWRETRKKSLGTFRYQFRILMLLLAPLILVIAYTIQERQADFSSPFRGFPVFFWLVSVISLTIHSTSAIPTERIRQTLDVLLVLPISSHELVKEKLAGVRRLIMILSVPFAVLIIFQAIWQGYVSRGFANLTQSGALLEVAATALTAIIYMPLIMWIGFQLGLRMRTQIQSLLATIAVIGSTCALPTLIQHLYIWPIFGFYDARDQFWSSTAGFTLTFVMCMNPAEIVTRNHPIFSNAHDPKWAIMIVGLHFLVYGYAWFWLRRNALSQFSRIVGRTEPGPETSDDTGAVLENGVKQ